MLGFLREMGLVKYVLMSKRGMFMGATNNGAIDESKILECLYEKTYTCPVCDNIFKSKAVRTGKAKLVSTGIDLKPEYELVNALYYGVVSCQLCGYTSLDTTFDKIGLKKATEVRKVLAPKFVARSYPTIYDVDIAIVRYKLALICSDLKGAKKSEMAYIALRLSWFYGEKHNDQKEKEYATYAYEGFKEAYTSENFPLFGMDETTSAYLIGALAYKLGDQEEALKWLSNVIISKTAQPRVKDKAMELKDLIKANPS
jgi:uncharacterized protein (DUF2225 family)